ncbi:cytochrome c oxidase subunit 3 [Kangiella sp. TOML190]|uniref:cytochrome c oxidase subunit 3 n=1 Tax=Kangiella sp. TOML190 TaxID=2931351 RepID=UPI00203AD274|nr:cytochrome c oxidase subunit 3 [Kangiella sp. TOML190]
MSEQTTNSEYGNYYVPEQSKLPIIGSVGLFVTAFGAGSMINGDSYGGAVLALGILILVGMLSTWWRSTIKESMGGLYSAQMSRSFRQGMMWFITSEVMFFFAFFGALFYIRAFVLPLLGGDFNGASTHNQLFPDYTPQWPMTETPGTFEPNVGVGQVESAVGTWKAMGAWGLPAINTAILLTSSWTLTIAHHALLEKNRPTLIAFTWLTAALGAIFLGLQVFEYYEAYVHYGLTLKSGVYGSTFFMLTGFHGMHVLVGTIFLIVLSVRCSKGHFTPKDHFAFEAGAWYWHFVDVVWVFLFIFVYMM